MSGQEIIIAEANKRLLALDLSINSNQPAMKSIVTDLGIEVDGNTAAKLRDALTPIKESLLANTPEATEEVAEVEATEETPEATEEVAEVKKKTKSTTYIMTVGHLPWGFNGRNHFFADKKPLINAEVMGNYASSLDIWLAAGWIKKGSYK